MWYLFKRGLQTLVILAILSAALFGLLSSMPGNPVDLLITSNPNVKPEDVIRLKRLRGLDRPWYIQYTRWLFGYPEPARPPVILPHEPVVFSDGILEIDLKDYLVDPNFVPNKEQLTKWLDAIWPNWRSSKWAGALQRALIQEKISLVLLTVAKHSTDMQIELVRRIEKESAKFLSVVGLFGAKADGLRVSTTLNGFYPYLWFLVKNSYGHEKLGRVRINTKSNSGNDLMAPINTQITEDETKPFSVDLKKFLIHGDDAAKAVFSLKDESSGTVSKDGIYTNQFSKNGQKAILVQVEIDGRKQRFGFEVEHGVVGHRDKFNKGFLYFFTGDRNALGFSQTYKRPVYDLLFGAPTVCGDGVTDAGETCDSKKSANDDCGPDCFRKSDSFLTKLDATISGFMVRSGRVGNTIQLMLPALLLSLVIAIPLGIFSAYRQYSVLDYVINFLAFLGISLPVFWFGIMIIYLFAENFQLFPAGGVQTPEIHGEGAMFILGDRIKHAVLPTIVLSIFYVGRWLRYMRASMLEILPQDYIRTARAKGLCERTVVLKHAFRNALIPVVTVLTLSIPSLFGGAVLTETVFSWPGIGRLQYEAVMNSDYYVAIVVFLVEAVLVMAGNLFADVVYVLVDPRIRKL